MIEQIDKAVILPMVIVNFWPGAVIQRSRGNDGFRERT